jgi:hypothetical protein
MKTRLMVLKSVCGSCHSCFIKFVFYKGGNALFSISIMRVNTHLVALSHSYPCPLLQDLILVCGLLISQLIYLLNLSSISFHNYKN